MRVLLRRSVTARVQRLHIEVELWSERVCHRLNVLGFERCDDVDV